MLFLWILGKDLENDWGKNEFLIFYLVCGSGAGFINVLINFNSIMPTVGASGAIYGILVAYGFTYPNRMVYLYGLFPIRVKYLVLGMGTIAFCASLYASQSPTSHITHVNGMIVGLVYILYNLKHQNIRLWFTLLLVSRYFGVGCVCKKILTNRDNILKCKQKFLDKRFQGIETTVRQSQILES